MSFQVPSQVFDGSYFAALASALGDKGAPAAPLTPAELAVIDLEFSGASTPEEFEVYDWDALNARVARHLPPPKGYERHGGKARSVVGTQLWMCHRPPKDAVKWLVRDTPVKQLWHYLNVASRKPAKAQILRGVQPTPGSLKRDIVQKRLADYLQAHPFEIQLLLMVWGERIPRPLALVAVEFAPDEATLGARIPSMFRSFGMGATLCAIMFAGDPRPFKRCADLLIEHGTVAKVIGDAPHYDPDNLPTVEQMMEQYEPPPDSEAARFWHAKSTAQQEELNEAADFIATQVEDLEKLMAAQARIEKLETEVSLLKKRALQRATQAEEKHERVEKKWRAQFVEANKARERQERRARALAARIEELELDDKRQKKQLRQSAQLTEETRAQLALLQGQSAQTSDQNGVSPTRSTDAVSSPPTTQSAPNAPIKVAQPSPLDEIFEWQAHGRRVRVTAREVRRLIDNNDEDRVAEIRRALHALQAADLTKSLNFLARLSKAGAHYPRVLTHQTTRVLVDASNVARFCANKYGKGQLAHLLAMRDELRRLDCWPLSIIADASLPHCIDAPHELREMQRDGEVQITASGVEADEVLAREARATGAYVVTNDARFFFKVCPDFEPPRISFRIHDNLVVVDEF